MTAEVVTSVVTVEIAVAINGTIVEDVMTPEVVMVAEDAMAAEDIRVVASAMSVETTAAAEIEAIAVAIGPAPNARILTSPSAPNAIVVMRRSPKERVIEVTVAEVVMVAEDIRVVASAMSVETTAAAEIEAIAVAIGPAPNARILTSPSAPNAIVVMRRSPKERVIEVTVVEVTVVTAVTVEKMVAVNVATVGDTEATAAVETETAARREETTAVATGIVRNAIIRISPSARSAIAVMRRSPKAEVAEATEVTDEAAAVEVTTEAKIALLEIAEVETAAAVIEAAAVEVTTEAKIALLEIAEVETAAAVIEAAIAEAITDGTINVVMDRAAVIVVDFSLAVIAQDHLEADPPVVGIVLVAVGSAAATKAKTSVELRACSTTSTPEIHDLPMRAFISARHEGHSWRRARRCCGSTRSNSIRRAISRKRSNSPVRSLRLIRDIQMRG
jgi:hypothetical protein